MVANTIKVLIISVDQHLGSSLWRGGYEGPLHKLMDKSSLLLKGIDKYIYTKPSMGFL